MQSRFVIQDDDGVYDGSSGVSTGQRGLSKMILSRILSSEVKFSLLNNRLTLKCRCLSARLGGYSVDQSCTQPSLWRRRLMLVKPNPEALN